MKYFNKIILFGLVLAACNANTTERGLIVKDSPYDVETTYNKLKTILSSNPNLTLLLELDHSKNAASVDLELSPTKIVMFGNPKLGTPLMQENPTTSIDLPQKIMIYSTHTASTKIAYNDPMYLKKRHRIEGKDDLLKTISEALDTMTNQVINN